MESQHARQATMTDKAEGVIRTYHATIQSLTPLSASTLYCQLASAEDIPYQPGQYAMVAINHTARAHSFATPPGSSTIEFLIDVRPQGVASHFWQQAARGQSITFTAPYGHFLLDMSDVRPLLFIAGSTGVAPLRAHLLWLLAQNTTRPVTLVVGHGQHTDAFWEKELSELAAARNFTYVGVIGRLTPTLSSIPNVADHTAYICGSSDMVTATAETLYRAGVPAPYVHYELFT